MQAATLLHRARRSAGLSQAEVAARAGTSQSAVNRYERGAAVPTLATLERLLAACGRELALSSRPLSGEGVAAYVRRHAGSLRRAAALHGVHNLRLFGSAARGGARATSDIDLLVDLELGRSLLDLVAFAGDAEKILGRRVDVATVEMLKDRIREEALLEAVPL